MVFDYFRLIERKDIEGLLRLFADDAIVYEPFSKEKAGLKGKATIRDFLLVTIFADPGTYQIIEFSNGYLESTKLEGKETDEISAIVTFGSEGILKGKFHFKFIIEIEVLEDKNGLNMTMPSKRIKELRIEIMK